MILGNAQIAFLILFMMAELKCFFLPCHSADVHSRSWGVPGEHPCFLPFFLTPQFSLPVHFPDSVEDPDSVPYGMDLRLTALRPVSVLDRYGTDCHSTLQCENRHFRFNLETIGFYPKAFYEFST